MDGERRRSKAEERAYALMLADLVLQEADLKLMAAHRGNPARMG